MEEHVKSCFKLVVKIPGKRVPANDIESCDVVYPADLDNMVDLAMILEYFSEQIDKDEYIINMEVETVPQSVLTLTPQQVNTFFNFYLQVN